VPELPDIRMYVAALERRIVGRRLERIRFASPFVLRSTEPAPAEAAGLRVLAVGHRVKRIHVALEKDVHVLIHLMIAGRLHWKERNAPLRGRNQLAALDFDSGTLVLTEAGTKRRAAIHLARGAAGLAAFDRGGIDPLAASPAEFRERRLALHLTQAELAARLQIGTRTVQHIEARGPVRPAYAALLSQMTEPGQRKGRQAPRERR